MRKKLTAKQAREFQTDPLEAMKKHTLDPRDVPIAEHGDAPNPPGTDINGAPVDVVESAHRTAPVQHPRMDRPFTRVGVTTGTASMEEAFKR